MSAQQTAKPPPFPPRSGYCQPGVRTPDNSSAKTMTPKDTPHQYKTLAMKLYAAANKIKRDKLYVETGRDMYEHIVGPVPLEVFFREVMTSSGMSPEAYTLPSGLPSLDGVTTEKELASKCTEAVKSGLFPSLMLRDTHKSSIRTPMTDVLRIPDLTICIAGEMEIPGERKPDSSDDPFVDPSQDATDEMRRKHEFIKDSASHMLIVGQLTAYIAVMFEIQPRTHGFSFLICGTRVRLFRWDRAGCVVTEAFDYTKTDYLWEFLHRYSLMSAADRGCDPSVRFDLSDDEKSTAEDLFAKVHGPKDSPDGPDDECHSKNFRRVTFKNDHPKETGEPTSQCELIVTYPRFATECVEGVATRCGLGILLAPDKKNWRIVYVKDTFRNSAPDAPFEKEGDIYELLHEKGVINIPEHICSGDAEGDWQHTATERFMRYACANVTIFGRQHYYTVLGDIGRPLDRYRSTRELISAICDALEAHQQAYEDAGLLHRDISPGNILITQGGAGMLIDWQYAKRVIDSDSPRQPRAEWKVGTWQFYSYGLQRKPSKPTHDLRDDLESFLWVTLYMIVRYRPTDFDPTTLLWYIHTTFDMSLPYVENGFRRYQGGERKLAFLRWDLNSLARLSAYKKTIPKPVTDLFFGLCEIFSPLYPNIIVKDAGTARQASWVAENRVVTMPVEMFKGKGRKAAALAREAYIAARQPGQTQTSAKTIPEPEVVIDYSKVISHDYVLMIFSHATAQDPMYWEEFGDDGAEDQLPKLKKAFREIQPNAAPVIATDTSSQIMHSSAARSGSKRSRNDDQTSRPTKRRRGASGAASAASSVAAAEESDDGEEVEAKMRQSGVVQSHQSIAGETGFDDFLSNINDELGVEGDATASGLAEQAPRSSSAVSDVISSAPSSNGSDVFV